MKLLRVLTIASTALVFAACSSDDSVSDSSAILENGGSATFKIAMPTAAATRAATLNDGTAQEYAVDNATLVLFDANKNIVTKRVFTASELTGKTTVTTGSNITETVKVDIPDKSKEPKYALALVNTPAEVVAALDKASTFDEFNQVLTAASGVITNNYQFMSNSTFDNTNVSSTATTPVYRTANGLQDLQEINPASISKDKTVAAATATDIFVERASAKVDLTMDMANQTTMGGSATIDSNTGLPTIKLTTGDQIKVLGWTLTATNKTLYPVKNISTADETDWNNENSYWMAANKCWRADVNYRSYWGKDGNYSTDAVQTSGFDSNFKYASFADAKNGNTLKNGTDTRCEYCLENTFDVKHQVQNQTTAVLIAAEYILNGKTAPEDFYKVYNTVYSKDDILGHIAEVLKNAGYVKSDGNTSTDLSASDFSLITDDDYIFHNIIKYTPASKTDNICKTGALTTFIVLGTADVNYNMNLLLNTVFGAENIQYYKGGLCYYTQPIRHFDDKDVPLYGSDGSTFEVFTGTNTSGINSTDKLGRYGVLRNNWYSLNITAFVQVGRPVPHNPGKPGDPNQPINPDPNFPDPNEPNPNTPDPNVPGKPTPNPGTPVTPTPDDVESYYMYATINVLPWAKRVQSVNF